MSGDAKRIVSLLPSATEWVCELGLQDRLVGVSHQCDYPPEVTKLPPVTRSRIDVTRSRTESNTRGFEIDAQVRSFSDTQTSLYELNSDTFLSLDPDLVLTQSLCNVCAVAEHDVLECLPGLGHPCRVLDLCAKSFDQVIDDARQIAKAAGNAQASLAVLSSLEDRIDRIKQKTTESRLRRPVVTLLEWVTPMFCTGHWTPELIQWAGGDDPIGVAGQPSREISQEALVTANPDILLVACCGMDLDHTRRELGMIQQSAFYQQLRCVKEGWVRAFDGSAYFNRPGPRLVDALEEVAELIRQWQNERGAR